MDFSSGAGAHHLCCYICATLFVLASFVTRAFSDTPPPDPIRPQLRVSDKFTSEYFNIFVSCLIQKKFTRVPREIIFLLRFWRGQKWHFWTILLSQRFLEPPVFISIMVITMNYDYHDNHSNAQVDHLHDPPLLMYIPHIWPGGGQCGDSTEVQLMMMVMVKILTLKSPLKNWICRKEDSTTATTLRGKET